MLNILRTTCALGTWLLLIIVTYTSREQSKREILLWILVSPFRCLLSLHGPIVKLNNKGHGIPKLLTSWCPGSNKTERGLWQHMDFKKYTQWPPLTI